jgi:uncharacterized protein (TIGR03083 family)
MDSDEMWEHVRSERLALADLLEPLDVEQWKIPSLCEAWTVREVVGHLLTGPTIGTFTFMRTFFRSGRDFDITLDTLARRCAEPDPAEMVARLRSVADDHWTPPGSGPEAPLTDLIVHGQDIRRPLGIDRKIPEPVLRMILTKSIEPRKRSVFPAGRFDNLRFEASDLDWSGGPTHGEVLSGPAEALMLAIWGRPVGLDALEGDGVDTLRSRLSAAG